MRSTLHALPAVAAALVLTACASVGRPEGGPRDEEPPVYVRSNPAMGQRGVDATSFSIIFNENVQLEDAFNKVVISPVQLEAPAISANGHRVSVRLRDTLKPNTTYTIDFGDAIKDLNEGNILDGFAMDFSTGPELDSMRVSGIVLQASNLEPAQGMLVGAYSNTSDTAIRTLPPDRIARTNQSGQFTIRNLVPGAYRIYALNDINRDWHWDRSEDVAFLDSLVVPDMRSIQITDTLYDAAGGDSLIMRDGIQYLPNDLLLTWFNQDYRAQYIKDYARPDRRRATINLGAPPDSLPQIRIVDGTPDSLRGRFSDSWAVPMYSHERDSLTLWITDSAVLATDSLRLSVRYRKPDSLDRLDWTVDTLRFYYRPPKRSKKEIEADTLPPAIDLLPLAVVSPTPQEVYLPLTFTGGQPLRSIDTAHVRFEMLTDTVWTPVKSFTIEPDTVNPVLNRLIRQEWLPGVKYRLIVDSAAIVGVYGEHNKPFEQEITVKALEEYSNLTLKLKGADSTAVVELLGANDEPVRRERVRDGKAVFRYLNPGTVYARMFFDTNGDGLWTTGILDSIQPEEVAYYPKKIELKRNWDVEQDWDIYELPVDRQKPKAILKNKPKLKRGEKSADEEETEDDDPLLGGKYNGVNNRRNNNRNNNNRNNNNNMGGFGGFGGGFRTNNSGSDTFRR